MTNLLLLKCDPKQATKCSDTLNNALEEQIWVQLIAAKSNQKSIPQYLLPKGPGIVIATGGSSGGSHPCLHHTHNLNQSASATSTWLKHQGIEPKNCLILNPLPLHHMSGLMPWWRSRNWGAEHHWLMPQLMRDPVALEKTWHPLFLQEKRPVLLSLVPTQLKRLIFNPAGLRWLKHFEIIWVGGARLSKDLEEIARSKRIKLAPCYGTTETAAMVSILSPKDFLEGKTGCGSPLEDIELRIAKNKTLEIRTQRLAQIRWENTKLVKLSNADGWWASGDIAELIENNQQTELKILGRVDRAINSGGETVFPEELEARFLKEATLYEVPLESVMFLPVDNKEWGQRLIALVRWSKEIDPKNHSIRTNQLKNIVNNWAPAERPCKWFWCPELSPNEAGKWDYSKWKKWVETNSSEFKDCPKGHV